MAAISEGEAPSYGDDGDSGFLIVSHENGGVRDLFQFLVFNNQRSGEKFLEYEKGGSFQEELLGDDADTPDHRWVIVVSIIARRIIKFFARPMEWTGYFLEFILNLLSLNGNFLGLLQRVLDGFCMLHNSGYRILKVAEINLAHKHNDPLIGNVVMPKRGSETFISAIGHIDGRIDLLPKETWQVEMGNRVLMDLCMIAAKLAYENAKVVKNVVDLHWKMHFVDFYNCWNDYQKEMSTQVFIMCDKPKDANLILISFRGTEPFDADDWITDFDYSWYEIPKIGKVHMGFLEALGLGNRANSYTFQKNLRAENSTPFLLNGFAAKVSSSDGRSTANGRSSVASYSGLASDSEKELIPEMGEITAYYAVKNKLKDLLKVHTNAKYVVTGHSLGGALAILFPTVLAMHEEEVLMQRLLGIYTFGQPRVGNRKLARFMESHLNHPESKYFRVVYCNDLVPRLPYDNKTFLYKHFGKCLYYDSLYVEQDIVEEPNRNYFGLKYVIPEYLNAMWELFRSLIIGFLYGAGYRESWESFLLRVVGLAIPGLSDHSPVDYVNSIRLGRINASK